MSLLPSERAQYSALIDDILANSDLQTIGATSIRKELQAKLGLVFTEKKAAVKELIIERFDAASAGEALTSQPPQAYHQSNGNTHATPKKVKTEVSVKTESSHDSPSNHEDAGAPPKKKRKQTKIEDEDPDAKLAAMLQAEENTRTRATRGGGAKKPVKKRTPKKKSADKVKAEDDSDIELNSDGEVKEKVKKGGFHKQYNLSYPLAELVGEPAVVKKIWVYIKSNELQDPSDKRNIRCDEKMQAVFKQDSVHMFTMNKLLGKHLYDIEE